MPDNRKSRDLWLTDAKVEEEIAKLRESEYVALARAEERQRYRRRQYLYQLRNLEKRGRKLAEEGWTPEEEDEDAEN
jgi:hypothetical protein